MTPQDGPALSFRRIPLGIYIGAAGGFAGALAVTIALLLAHGELYERYQHVERWRLFDTGCSFAQILLVAFGFFELARRQAGAARSITRVAAWLSLAQLVWFATTMLLAIIEPRDARVFYDWLGRGIGIATFSSAIALTIAARAWRVVPLAAAGLIAVQLTSLWIPGIGAAIQSTLGSDLIARQSYTVVREVVSSACLVFIAAALAARGRDAAPDVPAATRAFRIARGALLLRLVAAIAFATLLFGMRSVALAKFAVVGGPLLVVATTIAFAAAIDRAGSADVGLPRLTLAIGVALTLWCAAIQIEQVGAVFQTMRIDGDRPRFALIGPIAAAIGIALIGSSIAAFAASRGHADLARSARTRTLAFLMLSLGGAALPALLTGARSLDELVLVALLAAAIGIAALAVITGLLAQTIRHLELAPGLPGARVVGEPPQ